jgi:hypothetical protein
MTRVCWCGSPGIFEFNSNGALNLNTAMRALLRSGGRKQSRGIQCEYNVILSGKVSFQSRPEVHQTKIREFWNLALVIWPLPATRVLRDSSNETPPIPK